MEEGRRDLEEPKELAGIGKFGLLTVMATPLVGSSLVEQDVVDNSY